MREKDEPPEVADESREINHKLGGGGQSHTEADEKIGEDGHDKLEQGTDHEHGNDDDGNRIDEGGLDGGPHLDGLFDVLRDALENGVQNTAGFASFDHVGGEVVEDLGIGAQGIGQSRAAFDRGTDAEQSLFEVRRSAGCCRGFPDTAPEEGRHQS